MNTGFVLMAGLFAVGCGIVGAALLSRLDRAGTGFLLGALLGPLGLLVISVRRRTWIRRMAIEEAASEPRRKEQAWRQWRGY